MDYIRSLKLAVLVFLAMLFATHSAVANTTAQQHPMLVSPHWLNKNGQQEHVLIIDTRANQLYLQGHIPGAINIPVDNTFAKNDQTYRVGNLKDIANLFSENGISHNDHIILYDNGQLTDAARFFWVLEVYGHQHVSLLDGGLPAWLKTDFPIQVEPVQRSATNYIPTISNNRITTKLAMQLAMKAKDVSIIDARTPEEYAGKASKARRFGHIPEAINIPWTINIGDDYSLSSIINSEKLKAQYKVHDNPRIITYCNRGKQSGLTYFVLRYLGYNVSVYDGAWLEWGNDESLPIEQ